MRFSTNRAGHSYDATASHQSVYGSLSNITFRVVIWPAAELRTGGVVLKIIQFPSALTTNLRSRPKEAAG
jgi:hypothetical protein